MLYKLTYQKRGPFEWSQKYVLFGEINAVHGAYSALLDLIRMEGLTAVLEVRSIEPGGEVGSIVYSYGEFHPPGFHSTPDRD